MACARVRVRVQRVCSVNKVCQRTLFLSIVILVISV